LPRGFPQRFLLLAVYFSSLLHSVVFEKLARKNCKFEAAILFSGEQLFTRAARATLHLIKVM
jgi:hypothetical protein